MSTLASRSLSLFTRPSNAPFRLHTVVMIMGLGACVSPDDPVDYGQTESAISVNTAVSTSCSTAIVRGLSVQIAQEVNCSSPGSLVKFSSSSKIKFSSNAVLPYLHASAKADLVSVGAAHPLQVNSGYRTVAQQYLLARWHAAGRCGITVVAAPGTSNHESGRAIDLANWSTRVSAMGARHWAHDVPGDPVHFDHLTSPDNRGKDVRAFQRLWNRNHPSDTISVDGDYGPQTAARLRLAPAQGFAKGACGSTARFAPVEGEPAPELDLLSIDGPDFVAPGVPTHYTITISNPTATDWPATTRLVVADQTESELFDVATWVSPGEVGPIGVVVPAGGLAELDVDLVAPQVAEETPFSVTLAVIGDAGSIGTFDLAVTATPNGDVARSADSGDVDDGDQSDELDADGVPRATGGCNTGGATGGLTLLVAGLFVIRRRRSSPRPAS
jgi:uncharacterized protein (TIGR03382 family)